MRLLRSERKGLDSPGQLLQHELTSQQHQHAQALAMEPRGGTSDAGSLIDLELSPSVPAGPGPSAFPDLGYAASTGPAPSTGAAAAGRS